MRRALAVDENKYGLDHPDVARDLNNLATLLQATNRLDEAEPLVRRALAIYEQSYGSDHPNVAICLISLATLLVATNRLDEAEPLMRRAVQTSTKFQRRTGYEHLNLRTGLSDYVSLLQAMGRTEEQIQQQLHKLEESLGSEGS